MILRGDLVVAAFVALVAAGASAVPVTSMLSETVVVKGPAGRTVLPLSQERTVEVEGSTGVVTVRIEGGGARVVDAECPDRLCERMGQAKPGRPVVCAPNAVIVSAGDGSAVDAISR